MFYYLGARTFLTLYILVTAICVLWHYAAFCRGLCCLLSQKRPSEKDIQFSLGMIICDNPKLNDQTRRKDRVKMRFDPL